MLIETTIKLDRYKPRPYQLPIFDAIQNKGYKKVIAIHPRRSGKDISAWNLMIHEAIKRVGVYYYIFPTYAQGRKILWDNLTSDGFRVLDFLPSELVESRNEQQMRIRLKNGSLLQVIGSDSYDNSLVGTNCCGVVFSEYALSDPRAYQFVRPILNANNGWVLIISTPRGSNHLWELWNIAQHNKNEWFSYMLTVEDTQHISIEQIQKEIDSGELSEDLAQQEYWCSFSLGIDGSYYAKYLDKMRLKSQIGQVPWEPGYKVHTAWDLGYRDKMCIIFFQTIGQVVRIIDYYENNKEGLQHYASHVLSKPYLYGKHIGPHDIRVHDLSLGLTRWEMMRQVGITFTVAPNVAIIDGIEAVRAALSKIWIDETNCRQLIKALESYRQEYDVKKRVYKHTPLHDWASDPADALRYLCLTLPKTRDGLSPQELDRRYNEAINGNTQMSGFFRDDQY